MSGTLPFTLTFVPIPPSPQIVQPTLQSYSWLRQSSGNFFMLGGRKVGLHQFKTQGENFAGRNEKLWYCTPASSSILELLDLTLLPAEIGDPLISTNQQSYHDVEAGEWLIVGGYGLDSTSNQSRTFDTLIRIPITQFTQIVLSGQSQQEKATRLAAIITVQHDPFFAVTGGALRKLGDRYLLLFGQGFQGRYNPFAGIVAQEYVDAVRFFRFDGQRRAIGLGELRSPDLDQPFHRRDGVVINSVDPNTGQPRVIGFGGVFPPGKLGGYLNPVYVEDQGNQLFATTDRTVTQLFCHYECPVVVVYDPGGQAVYHTFFGGISRSWYWQTPAQNQVYSNVTAEGRNDGLPFVADISTMILSAGGQSAEYIAPAPVPNNMLHGSSTDFIPLPNALNPAISQDGVINLSQISAGEPVLVGYIYGGIEAAYPLPVIPNYGTQASGWFYQVMLSTTPASGYIPSSQGNLANGVLSPQQMRAGVKAR